MKRTKHSRSQAPTVVVDQAKRNKKKNGTVDLVTSAPKDSKVYRVQEFYVNCCRVGTAAEAILKWRDMGEEEREPYRLLCQKHNAGVQAANRG